MINTSIAAVGIRLCSKMWSGEKLSSSYIKSVSEPLLYDRKLRIESCAFNLVSLRLLAPLPGGARADATRRNGSRELLPGHMPGRFALRSGAWGADEQESGNGVTMHMQCLTPGSGNAREGSLHQTPIL
jgi:hypothetical protein